MRKQHLYISVAVILALSLVSSCFAAWSNTGYSGNWTSYHYPEFSYSSDAYTEAASNETYGAISSFTGFHSSVRVDINATDAGWFDFNGFYERIYFTWAFESSTGEIFYVTPSMIEDTSFWLGGESTCYCPFLENEYYPSGSGFEVYVYQASSTQINCYIAIYDGETGLVTPVFYHENMTVTSGFWTSVTPYFYIVREGRGSVNATFSDTWYSGASTVTLPNYSLDTDDTIGGWLDSDGSSIVGWLSSVWDIISAGFTAIANTLVSLTPYAPLIFAVWFLDAFFASAETGSFQPVGSLFMWLWSLLCRTVEIVVDIADVIIPF